MILSEEGHRYQVHATYDPHASLKRKQAIFFIECCRCGFEPEDQFALPTDLCPKCHSDTWRRVVRPRCLIQEKVGRRYRVASTG